MFRGIAGALAVFGVTLLVLPAVAGAHVSIEAEGALGPEGIQEATLRVPNECEGSTTAIELNFPATPAMTSVVVTPITGWTATNTTGVDGAVTVLTLSGSLSGTDAQTFNLTVGPIPAGVDQIGFTAVQRCSDGEVIRWIEPTPAGGGEPEFPAPVLVITRDANSGGAVVEAPPETTTSTVAVTTTAADEDEDESGNTGLIVGIVVAAVVVLGGGAYLAMRRKR
jgi:uncharacterized protein YcnI